MNYRLTIGLLIVFAILAGAVFFVQGQPAETPTPAAKAVSVLSFLASDVASLSAKNLTGTTVANRGSDGKWALQSPAPGPADSTRLDGLISRLGTLSASRAIEDVSEGSLAEYGLDQPATELKVTLTDGGTKSLLLGKQTIDKVSYYARLPKTSTIYLISASVGGEIARLATDPPRALPASSPVTVLTPVPAQLTPSVPR